MNIPEFPIGWRQSRIFTSDFGAQWYFNILANVVVPFAHQFPNTPFFFSRYQVPFGQDDGDTNINELPPNFLENTANGQVHRSIRLRFCPSATEEAALKELIEANAVYWHYDFRAYDVLGEFGGSRFCPSFDISFCLRRTHLLGSLLYINSLFVLHSMRQVGENWTFERNTHEQNRPFDATFISVLHMLNQPCGQNNGEKLPILIPDPQHPNQAYGL